MNNQHSLLKLFAVSALALALFCVSATELRSQTQTDRERALALFEAGNFVDALPLLEKVARESPNDPAIMGQLGFSVFAASTAEKDPEKRKQLRERAKQLLTKAQALGDNSNLTAGTLEGLSRKDDTAVPFSDHKEADAYIRKGEEAFVRGDYDAALAAYKHALELDPQLYEAALFAGDVEFKKGYNSTDEKFRAEHFAQAGIWFAKAIAIEPNRETAYRYWGDALEAGGKTEEARDKFVDAIVADPGASSAYVGLSQWAEGHDMKLGHPKIDVPSNVTIKKPDDLNVTIKEPVISRSDDGSAAWATYGLVRANWMDTKEGKRSEKFAKAYPDEPAYRHSLAEEVEALRAVLTSLEEQTKQKSIKQLSPSLDNLVMLNKAGLLESYIFFVKPDKGIVKDYEAYKKANRDKLRRYWVEVVVGRE
ncbi:MAG TPA: tetratricopeptide repeat protein [Pyrinomonadaceae bacterium]|nr:tetratricopeptide repeat protein [Pyrinomonadaceae bacterium]